VKTAKALVAAGMAGLTALSAGLTDGKLTTTEIVVAVLALLGAYGATWTVPNAGTVSRAKFDREVVRARYSHTSYGGRAGDPQDAGPLPTHERPEVQ
jgi:hypothetical protein